MSLKVRTFKDLRLNKYLEIIILLAFLSTVVVSLKFTYGQSSNLTMNQTNGTAQNHTGAYGDVLMDVIKNANITIPPDLRDGCDGSRGCVS